MIQSPEKLTTLPEPGFSRLPTVKAVFGHSRSTIYRLAAQGKFPSPIKISERSSAWKNSDLNEHMRKLLGA
ncbi:MAG: AlpA family phage regulatory protein [Halothiobacillaceae bacterium]|nr:AlpA family phage regulatory protein [Halothiobacillaceae bacterium]